MVQWGIAVEFVPRRPIFEKCPHLREKGGVLTLRTPVGFALTPTVCLVNLVYSSTVNLVLPGAIRHTTTAVPVVVVPYLNIEVLSVRS